MSHTRTSRKALSLVLSAALGLGLLAPTQEAAAGPDGKQIMSKVADARKLNGSEAVVKMKILNKKGQARERTLSMATKMFGDTEKRVYKFLAPADVKGTGVLVFDHSGKDDDVWVFMPALRKVRRIVSSQKSKDFMGSEFSYADLNIPSISDYVYKVLGDETAGGESCFVVEVTPKNDSVAESEGYSKKKYWISKKTYTVRKGLYYNLDGKEFKELSTKDVKNLGGKYRAMHMEMVNKTNGRKSVFITEKVNVTSPKDEFFEQSYIERQ